MNAALVDWSAVVVGMVTFLVLVRAFEFLREWF